MSIFSLHIDARLRDTRPETARRERLTALNASHFDKFNDREGSLSLSKGTKSRVPCQKNNCSLILNTYLLV